MKNIRERRESRSKASMLPPESARRPSNRLPLRDYSLEENGVRDIRTTEHQVELSSIHTAPSSPTTIPQSPRSTRSHENHSDHEGTSTRPANPNLRDRSMGSHSTETGPPSFTRPIDHRTLERSPTSSNSIRSQTRTAPPAAPAAVDWPAPGMGIPQGLPPDMPSPPLHQGVPQGLPPDMPSPPLAQGMTPGIPASGLPSLGAFGDVLAGATSIGFPSIEATSRSSTSAQGRSTSPKARGWRVKSPPRPSSPINDASSTSTGGPATLLPLPETSKVLQLMKITCGRMHGILYFRPTSSASWSSGYCAINVASASLIYQMKGEVAQARTLFNDLRGCYVRSHIDQDLHVNFLEVSTPTSLANGEPSVQLRPHVPETFDSWLAAFLCWQPLTCRGLDNTPSLTQAPPRRTRKPSVDIRGPDSRQSSPSNREAAIIKVGKMLMWDLDMPRAAPTAPPTRRISTYRQLRTAAGTPWRRVSCTLQENGEMKLYIESTNTLAHRIPLNLLLRSAIQRLHNSVLADDFCMAIVPRYADQSLHNLDDKLPEAPIYLSLDNRVIFEVWYVLLRAFTIPALYGPSQAALRRSVDLSRPRPDGPDLATEGMFRLERLINLRLIEAKVYAPLPPNAPRPSISSDLPATQLSRTRTGSTFGAGRDPLKGDYHAEVVLDGEIRGRTALKTDTSRPFWREDYELNDLPPTLARAAIVLKSRTPGIKDWSIVADESCDYEASDVEALGRAGEVQVAPLDTMLGLVDLDLATLERGQDRERWWPIRDEQDEVMGEMMLKLRFDETIVLMSNEYQQLSEMLHTFPNGLTIEIAAACSHEMRTVHETLLNIFQVSGAVTSWIMALVEDEIDGMHKEPVSSRLRYSRRIVSQDATDTTVQREMFVRDLGKAAAAEAHLLFRGNSLLTKTLDCHMRRIGKDYLEETLGSSMRDIDESSPECEVDPHRVARPEDLQRNWRNLISLTENVWRAIAASAYRCPPELRIIFRHIRSCADDRFGSFLRTVEYSSVSGFLFLRFFCPAVLNPKLFGMLKDHPRATSLRTLTLIAKSLQTLANLSTFGHKEPWMEPMNAFLNSNRREFKEFMDRITDISPDRVVSTSIPPSYATPVAILHRLPATSKEGSASLPYLLDMPRELAALVSIWNEGATRVVRKGQGQTTARGRDNPAVPAFEKICESIRDRTRDAIRQARDDDRPSGLLEISWAELLDLVDQRTATTMQRRQQQLLQQQQQIDADEEVDPLQMPRNSPGMSPMLPSHRGTLASLNEPSAGRLAGSSISSTASTEEDPENSSSQAQAPNAPYSRGPSVGEGTPGTGQSSPGLSTPPESSSEGRAEQHRPMRTHESNSYEAYGDNEYDGDRGSQFPPHAMSWGSPLGGRSDADKDTPTELPVPSVLSEHGLFDDIFVNQPFQPLQSDEDERQRQQLSPFTPAPMLGSDADDPAYNLFGEAITPLSPPLSDESVKGTRVTNNVDAMGAPVGIALGGDEADLEVTSQRVISIPRRSASEQDDWAPLPLSPPPPPRRARMASTSSVGSSGSGTPGTGTPLLGSGTLPFREAGCEPNGGRRLTEVWGSIMRSRSREQSLSGAGGNRSNSGSISGSYLNDSASPTDGSFSASIKASLNAFGVTPLNESNLSNLGGLRPRRGSAKTLSSVGTASLNAMLGEAEPEPTDKKSKKPKKLGVVFPTRRASNAS